MARRRRRTGRRETELNISQCFTARSLEFRVEEICVGDEASSGAVDPLLMYRASYQTVPGYCRWICQDRCYETGFTEDIGCIFYHVFFRLCWRIGVWVHIRG